MKLSSLLNPDLICVQSAFETKGQAIDAMIQKMCKRFSFEAGNEQIVRAVADREALGGTTFATGIAVPHGRLENFNDLVIGICVPTTPIPTDTVPIRMLVLILTNKSSSSLYLNSLAAFVKLSKDEAAFGRLLSAGTSIEFWETFKKLDIEIKKELTVSDIMSKDIQSVTARSTLKELADIFYSQRFSYMPVVDDQGKFIAEVNILDMLKVGVPDYATMIGSLKFLSTFEPLEELLKNEDTLTVSQIMKKPSLHFSPDTSIIEAVLEFTQNKRRHIAVVQDDRIVGIVSVMDVLNKVLRG